MKKRPNDTSKFPPVRRATVAPVRPVKGGAPRPITSVPTTIHPIATEASLSSSTAISPGDRADPVITATPETTRGEAEPATASPFAALPGKIVAASKTATNRTGAAPKRENLAQQPGLAGKEKEKEKDREREKCPFRRLIGKWVNDCRTDGLSETTLHDYADKASKFRWWWTEHTRYSQKLGAHPENVTTKEAREFASYLREKLDSRWGLPVPPHKQQLSAASVEAYGRTVKVFFSWLERQGHIEATPFNKSVHFSNRHKKDRLIKYIQQDDLERIFSELMKPDRLDSYSGRRNLAMLALLLDSGIRRGELLSIRLCDLDLKNNRCQVSGKSGSRPAFFSEMSRIAIAAYLQQYRQEQDDSSDSALWLCEDGVPLSQSGFGMVIRRLEERSGVDFHPHRLRHTFATSMAKQGVDVYRLKELLGHRSITTTMIYVQQNPELLAETHRLHSPLTALPISEKLKRRGRPRKSHQV